jgi:hypothetical protein
MRNDGLLYSGLTAPVRREKLEQTQTESKLDGKAEMVLDEIAKLKAAAMDISNVVLDESIADDVKLRKLERMRERFNDLAVLERRMQKLLGVKPTRGRA